MSLTKVILVAAGTLAGCAVNAGTELDSTGQGDDAGSTVESLTSTAGAKAALKKVDKNLAKLKALQVVDVKRLVIEWPDGAMNCYGPCPGSEGAIKKAKETAALRLEKLTKAAVLGAKHPKANACDETSIDDNIAALQALRIIDVGGLLEAQPKNNPQCYNFPCSSDIEAAQATNCTRAGKLAGIVEAAKGL